VGQIINEAAKVLVSKKMGKFSCLAGVGSHGEGFITSARKADRVVALDGCAAKCSYKTLNHARIEPTIHVIVTDLGIKKDNETLNPIQEDVNKVLRLLENRL
jgi:uncharacterized metal-binding protein